MKLFKSKKIKKAQPTDNSALNELINEMPSQSGHSDNKLNADKPAVDSFDTRVEADNAQVTSPESTVNDPEPDSANANTVKPVKSKKSLFGRKKAKKGSTNTIAVDKTQAAIIEDNSDTSDDFLAILNDKPKNKNTNASKWLLNGLIILLILMILYYLYSTFIATDNEATPTIDTPIAAPVEELPTLSQGAEPAPVLDNPEDVSPQVLGSNPIESTDAASASAVEPALGQPITIPDPEAIIAAEMPDNEVMAKEEIDRLADEAAQLEEQGKLIADQVAMMDELTEKKEEQIALLEQQIALLEKQKNSQ